MLVAFQVLSATHDIYVFRGFRVLDISRDRSSFVLNRLTEIPRQIYACFWLLCVSLYSFIHTAPRLLPSFHALHNKGLARVTYIYPQYISHIVFGRCTVSCYFPSVLDYSIYTGVLLHGVIASCCPPTPPLCSSSCSLACVFAWLGFDVRFEAAFPRAFLVTGYERFFSRVFGMVY